MIWEVAAKGRDDGDHWVSIEQIALHGHEGTGVVAGNVVPIGDPQRLIVIAVAIGTVQDGAIDGDSGPWRIICA